MHEIQIEYIKKMGVSSVAHFLTDRLVEKTIQGYVPVFLDDFITSFLFVEADIYGYPMKRYIKFLSFVSVPSFLMNENITPIDHSTTVIEKEVEITRPLVSNRVDDYLSINGRHYIFMWEGRTTQSREVPLSELSVKELQEMSHKIIQKRNDVIMDQAFINRFIK